MNWIEFFESFSDSRVLILQGLLRDIDLKNYRVAVWWNRRKVSKLINKIVENQFIYELFFLFFTFFNYWFQKLRKCKVGLLVIAVQLAQIFCPTTAHEIHSKYDNHEYNNKFDGIHFVLLWIKLISFSSPLYSHLISSLLIRNCA